MKMHQQPKEKRVSPEERVSYPPSILEPAMPQDESLDGSVQPRPIFKVEKVARIW